MSNQQNGQRLIDVAKAHFQGLKDPKNRRSIVVPEWGKKRLYVGALSERDMAEATEWAQGNSEWMNAAFIARLTEDKEGTRPFSFGDVEDIYTKTEATVVQRITKFIVEASSVSTTAVEDAEKNS